MKKRSAAAAAMALILAAGTIAPVFQTRIYAESTVSDNSDAKEVKSMEELLASVKSRVSIPAEYSDFSYRKSTSKGVGSYSFKWNKETETGEASGEYISVTVSENGTITSYYFDNGEDYYTNKPAFGRLSNEQLLEAAQSAFVSLNPDLGDKVEFDKTIIKELRYNNITISFTRRENGSDMVRNTGYVTVNKNTGELTGFRMTWWDGAEFEDTAKAISLDELKKAYKENIKLSPYYQINSKYNEKTGSFDKSAVILYSPESDTPFDASSGKPTTMMSDYALAYNTSHYNEKGDYNMAETEEAVSYDEAVENPATGIGDRGEITFTDSEKKALMDSGRYYSKDDLVKLLKEDKYLGLTDDYVLESSSFLKDEETPSGYSWTMNFFINTSQEYKSIYVKADAESGKITYFYKYGNEPRKIINIKTVNKIAEDAAEYYLPEVFGEFRPAAENTADADEATSRNIIFNRYYKDLPVNGNSISVKVNSDGEVVSFSSSYDDIELPDSDIISSDEAYEKALEQIDFRLYYDGFLRLNGEAQTYLLYSADKYYLDAKTGKLCTSSGSPLIKTSEDTSCPYTDISGNWAEKYITTLYDYGIILTSEGETQFNPESAITEAEFAHLLDSLFMSNVMPLMYKDYTFENRSEFGNTPLTKASSAKLFVLALDGGKFADCKNIYKSPFKDVSDDREDIGYIALAYGMGAVKADSEGNFNPDGKISRAYAMYLIYNYIKQGE